jgi:hypothetical protein
MYVPLLPVLEIAHVENYIVISSNLLSFIEKGNYFILFDCREGTELDFSIETSCVFL